MVAVTKTVQKTNIFYNIAIFKNKHLKIFITNNEEFKSVGQDFIRSSLNVQGLPVSCSIACWVIWGDSLLQYQGNPIVQPCLQHI